MDSLKTNYTHLITLKDLRMMKLFNLSPILKQVSKLSNKWFSEYKIDTKTEADHLYETIITAIYNFKTYHISKKIRMITKELESNPKLSEEDNRSFKQTNGF